MTKKYFGTDGIEAKLGSIQLLLNFLLNLALLQVKCLQNHGIIKKNQQLSLEKIQEYLDICLNPH